MSDPAVVVQSFSFRPDDFIEITFIETREQTKGAGLIRTLVVDPKLLRKEDLDDVLDTITDFIDEVLRRIRSGDDE